MTEAAAACDFHDYFELELVLDYAHTVPIPPGHLLSPEVMTHVERIAAQALRQLLRHKVMVLFGSADIKMTQLHLRGVLLTTHALEGWTWAGQLTPDLRQVETEPVLAEVRHDMLLLTKRPEQNAGKLCRLLHEYEYLHGEVHRQLHNRFTDDGRRQLQLGLQYYGTNAHITHVATQEMVENARYHKRYLLSVPPEQWLQQYDDLLLTMLRRNAQEYSHGYSPAAQAMRRVMERVGQVLHEGVQRLLQGRPGTYPHLHLEVQWDGGAPQADQDPRPYRRAREAWWTRKINSD